MAKSYFSILGVTSSASPNEVRSAYRRLAKEFHPDHYQGDSRPFREIQEAYSVLGNPNRRRAYEQSLAKIPIKRQARYTTSPEPLIPKQGPVDIGEVSLVRSFENFRPSYDEIFEWLWDNFSNIDLPKSGRIQNLTFEVPLTRDQALRGGNAKVMVPVRAICPLCRGAGGIGYYECSRCAGEDAISGEMPISISFPSGLRTDHAVVVPLERFGIRNLHLTVLFRLAG